MLSKYIGSKVVAVILLLMASICLYTEVSLTDVNIDLSDEGYHLTRFIFPYEVNATIIRDHLYTSHLFSLLDNKISSLRLSNIFLLVISCGIFCYGFSSFFLNINLNTSKGLILYLTLFSSAIIIQLPSLWIERVPAYNNITSFISLTTIGIFFKSLHPDFSRINKAYFFIGLISSFAFFIKPPSNIVLISFILIINLCFYKDIKSKLVYLLLGSLSCLIFHFTIIESFPSYIDTTRMGFSFASFAGHTDLKSLLLGNLNQLFVTIKFSILYNKISYILFFLIVLFSRNLIDDKKIFIIFIIFFLIISLRHFFLGDINGGPSLYWYQWRFYTAQLFFSILYLAYILLHKNKLHKSFLNPKIIICLMSLFMPALLSFGTNNIIMFNMNFYTLIFIFCFLFILSSFADTSNKLNCNSYFPTLLLLFCIGPFHSQLNGRLSESFYGLSAKTYSYKSTQPMYLNNETVFVDNELKSICESIIKIINKNDSTVRYLLNFTGSPGFNYISYLPHPIQPWTLISSDDFTLSNIDNDIFSESAILLIPSRYQTFDGLDKYFPAWHDTHTLKESFSLEIQNQTYEYELYFPKTEVL